jgi:hypothetical protein
MSPVQTLAIVLAWWRATFIPCGHELDIRIERGRVECGVCGRSLACR